MSALTRLNNVTTMVMHQPTTSPLLALPEEIKLMIMSNVVVNREEDGLIHAYNCMKMKRSTNINRELRRITGDVLARLDNIVFHSQINVDIFLKNKPFAGMGTHGLRRVTAEMNDVQGWLELLEDVDNFPHLESLHMKINSRHGQLHSVTQKGHPLEVAANKAKDRLRNFTIETEAKLFNFGSWKNAPSLAEMYSSYLRDIVEVAINVRRVVVGEPAEKKDHMLAYKPPSIMRLKDYNPNVHPWTGCYCRSNGITSRNCDSINKALRDMLQSVAEEVQAETQPSWFWDVEKIDYA